MFQVCTAVVTGMAGCAGTILPQEPLPPKTALIILETLTPRVSSEADILLPSHDEFAFNPLFYLKKSNLTA